MAVPEVPEDEPLLEHCARGDLTPGSEALYDPASRSHADLKAIRTAADRCRKNKTVLILLPK